MDKTELFYWAIWWGWWIIQFILYSMLTLLMCDGIYQIIVSIRGFWGAKKPPQAKRYRRFVVLVPAHNESAVIIPLLKSLAGQNYPKNCYKVYVSCDNCTDNTAELVRQNGAVALERFDKEHNGKTWNVRWALTQIPLSDFDALTMFDADNLADTNFLMAMNNYMEQHPEAEALQGVLDVKNPDDNWLTRSYALAYWFTNRFWQHARGLWKLSCTLGGTGLVIRMATLKRIGWNLQSLTEDLEMSTIIILSGSRVHWNNDAIIYDEKPQDIAVSRRQRTRWMQGHYWVFWQYGRAALKSFFMTRRLQYLDLFLYLLAPAKSCLGIIIMLGGMAFTLVNNMILYPSSDIPQSALEWGLFFGLPIISIVAFCLLCAIAGPSFHQKKFTLRYVKDTFAYFWFGLTWIPILFKAAFLAKDQGNWVKTEHTRNMLLDDVGK
ncbi:MAG: glycosyltransferase family 2 protein [Synergistes sp.]|nr:glycosyltransferase family 2 protein [Synergistes sp.]